MLKKMAAIALATVIGVGFVNLSGNTALAGPQVRYYDMKQKKWVPVSENPYFKRRMKTRAKVAKKSSQPAKKVMRKKPVKQQKVSTLIRRNKAVERAKKKPAKDPNASPIPAQIVAFDGRYAKGTIVVDHSDRRLYHVLGNGKAKAYAVGVGKEGFEWTGTNRISRKAEWPGWTPPARMIAREKKKGRILPAHMEGGPNNPLGARAMYLGSSYYRIHGTNQPWSLGKAVSSGCIRMANNDVTELYEKVKVGTKVIVRP